MSEEQIMYLPPDQQQQIMAIRDEVYMSLQRVPFSQGGKVGMGVKAQKAVHRVRVSTVGVNAIHLNNNNLLYITIVDKIYSN